MRHFARLSAVAILLASGTAIAQTAQFDPARLSQHVQTLGSDAFEGRAPATNGETKTVAYLVGTVRQGRPTAGRRYGERPA